MEFLLVSRGDSTLRGHYPAETESLREGLEGEGVRVDGEVICPFFEEGGRFTAGGCALCGDGGRTAGSCGETEFAKVFVWLCELGAKVGGGEEMEGR